MVPPSGTIFFPGGQFAGAVAGAPAVCALDVPVESAAAVLLVAAGGQLAEAFGDALAAGVFLWPRCLPLVAFVFFGPGDETEGAGVGDAGTLCEVEGLS